MKLRLTSLTKGLLATVVAVALSGMAAGAETLRLGHHHAVGGAVDIAANHFAKNVQEKIDGRIVVRVFPAAQLGQEREAYALVEQGGLDISITSASFLDKSYPPIGLTILPFIFDSWEASLAAYDGEFGDTIRTNVRDASNTEILAYLGLGFRDMFFAGDPVTRLEDMKGLKMRSPEHNVFITMFEAMGAKPVPVTFGELYTAMQTGVAEGFDSPPGTAVDQNFQEVSGGVLKTNHMFSSMVFAMNKQKFSNLSPEDQSIIVEAARDAVRRTMEEVVIPAEAAAYDVFVEAGMKVAEPDNRQEWVDAMKPLIDDMVSSTPGTKMLFELLARK